ncbi:MAG: hypothetical protein FRX49_10890 [Trebouxia sp. A1-2]|nr:MAG: hypothetical protein FRX49_10890 [Trebouxia sp. A1-2]
MENFARQITQTQACTVVLSVGLHSSSSALNDTIDTIWEEAARLAGIAQGGQQSSLPSAALAPVDTAVKLMRGWGTAAEPATHTD